MGQCFSSPITADTPERFKARWQQGGLGEGLGAAYEAHKYDNPNAVSNYTTTANVGLGRSEDRYVFLNDKAPGALQLERIDENQAMQVLESPAKALSSATTATVPQLAEEQRMPSNWTKGELIGQGAFGSVYLGMDIDTGQLMAVKQVHVAPSGAQSAKVADHVRSLEEEVKLLQQLKHPNIVRYLGTERTEEQLNIFLEYVPGGSIASLLAKFGSFRETVIKVYTKQLLMGLEYLHAHGIIHRDIKGANILVDNTGLVKLADFGASKQLEDLVTLEGCKSVKGTPYWMAPEVIKQEGHGRQADIWSVACTVIEMATGKPPWSQYGSQVAAMFHIASSKGPPTIPEHLSPDCKDFLYLCFNRNWKDRPQASKLLHHPFLADVVCRTVAAPFSSTSASREIKAWRAPDAGTDDECSQGAFRTPSPVNPKLAAAAAAAAAAPQPAPAPCAVSICLQPADLGHGLNSDGGPLSPLGQHAASRPGQFELPAAVAAAAVPPPAQAAQQQRRPVLPAAGEPAPQPAAEARGGGAAAQPEASGQASRPVSPVKRIPSLRASAPVLSGFASVALSQQREPLEPLQPLRMPRAPTRSGSNKSASSARSGAASGMEEAAAAQLRSSSNSSVRQPERPADTGLVVESAADSSTADGVVAMGSPQDYDRLPWDAPEEEAAEPPLAAAEGSSAAAATPGAPTRTGPCDYTGQQEQQQEADAPHSANVSGGTNKSDYNPMEEPTWLGGQLEGPLPGEGTPPGVGSSLAPAPAAGPAGCEEVSSCAAGAARHNSVEQQQRQQPAAAEATGEQEQEREHMVWVHDDLDGLPWDVERWSLSSSGPHARHAGQEQQQEQQQQEEQQQREPVDEDLLLSALSHKADLDLRASMALFEKCVNVPAQQQQQQPAISSTASKGGSVSPIKSSSPIKATAGSSVRSGSGSHAASSRSRDRLSTAASQLPQGSGSRRSPLQAQQEDLLLASTAAAVLPPQLPRGGGGYGAPPAASMAAPLGYALGMTGREAVWEQELSRELNQWRMQASSAATPAGPLAPTNRRISMHGSPLKY